jgi:hypothetical protein
VPSPNGSGGAPRQGWINAMDGNIYRLWFFTFAHAFNEGPKSNAYLGAYTLYTPLSRRLLLITNIPFVLRNSAGSGLPIISPIGLTTPTSKNQTTFGDISFAPPRLAARDARLLAPGRGRGAGPDRQPAPCGEDRPDPGRQLLEQFRGPMGDPRRNPLVQAAGPRLVGKKCRELNRCFSRRSFEFRRNHGIVTPASPATAEGERR